MAEIMDETLTRNLPVNFGPHKGANGNARILGPCGDTMEFWLTAGEDGKIHHATFTTDGCDSSVLCGTVACQMAVGTPLSVARKIGQLDILSVAKEVPEDHYHCALLAANTLHEAASKSEQRLRRDRCDSQGRSCDTCSEENCDDRNGGKQPQRADPVRPGVADAAARALEQRLQSIDKTIVVLSGKGGVGKSTVAVNLATSLAMAGHRVGLLDVDIHGPSVPTMLGIATHGIAQGMRGLLPAEIAGIKVMSLGFLLERPNAAVIWRGPMKMGVIQQFLKDVDWGELDYLVVDCPPGTGDEPLSVCQMLGTPTGAVVVTTPQEVANVDVRKSVDFCQRLKIPVFGIVENMAGFVCPSCGHETQVFGNDGGKRLAESSGVPYLGRVPIDPAVVEACDGGKPFVYHYSNTPAAKVFSGIVAKIAELAS
jgi:Mrp family chromosome partitioning ATPase